MNYKPPKEFLDWYSTTDLPVNQMDYVYIGWCKGLNIEINYAKMNYELDLAIIVYEDNGQET